MKNKSRKIIGLVALLLIMISIIRLDFQNLSFSNNRSGYLNVIAMSLISMSMCFSVKAGKSKKED
jgi:hypothetical protein